MTAEYIILSMVIRDLIPLLMVVNEVNKVLGASLLPCQAYSKVFEDNIGTVIPTTMP